MSTSLEFSIISLLKVSGIVSPFKSVLILSLPRLFGPQGYNYPYLPPIHATLILQ